MAAVRKIIRKRERKRCSGLLTTFFSIQARHVSDALECPPTGIRKTFRYVQFICSSKGPHPNILFLGEESCEDEDALNRKCSDVKSPSRKRRFRDALEANLESDDECEEVEEVEDVSESLSGPRLFRPLYLLSEWSGPETTTKIITVAIVLPTGIETGNFSIRIVEDGKCLLLVVQWPDPLIDLRMMHKKWLSHTNGSEMYHPKVTGFEAGLKRLRKRTIDYIESSAHILLPFAVQSHILSKHNLGWRDNGTKMVYVDLRAAVEQYAVVNDDNEFEIM